MTQFQPLLELQHLFTIASILSVPVEFFFEDMPKSVTEKLPDAPATSKKADKVDFVMGFVGSREGLDLNSAFSKIAGPAQRKAFLDLVKTLA